MSSTPFGEHLKRERELRGVSLDEIAAATRIKTSFLEALENGRWNELPGGAFNRGFVRATAHFLGLNEDDMVAEYALETGGEPQAKVPSQPSGAMPRDYRPAFTAIATILALLMGGAWFARHEISVRRQKRAMQVVAASAATVPSPTSAAAPNATNPVMSAPGAITGSSPTTSPTTNQLQPASDPASAIQPEATASLPLRLRLETSRTSQIRVTGDGKLLFRGRLHSDDPKNFQARDEFEVTSNDANAVRLQLNGEAIPFDGSSGRRGSSVSISRKNLKESDSPH
jgi:cytoskeleton protein RodZ